MSTFEPEVALLERRRNDRDTGGHDLAQVDDAVGEGFVLLDPREVRRSSMRESNPALFADRRRTASSCSSLSWLQTLSPEHPV